MLNQVIDVFNKFFFAQFVDFIKLMSQVIDSKINELKEHASIDSMINFNSNDQIEFYIDQRQISKD